MTKEQERPIDLEREMYELRHPDWRCVEELEELLGYLKMFEPITGGRGSVTEQVRQIIRHYATQAGRMHKGTGGWAPRKRG